MTHHKNIGLLILMLVCLCFFSLPVMSGEHPWDADDGTGDVHTDTTGTGDSGDSQIMRRVTVDAGTGDVTTSDFSLTSRFTFNISYWFYTFTTNERVSLVEEKKAAVPTRIEKRKYYSVRKY